MSDYFNIMGNNGERRVFKIPINGLSGEEAEKQLKELISDYKGEHEDYWIPTVEIKKPWYKKLFRL